MPRKGENIYKRKDGRWEGRYIRYHDAAGKVKYGYVYGNTYNDVKDILVQKKADVPVHGSRACCSTNSCIPTLGMASKFF